MKPGTSLAHLVRPNVAAMTPYSSARSEFSGEASVWLDANENPHDFAWSRYPDPYQRELKVEIAKLRNVSPDQIVLGNGSDELIDLLIRAFCVPGRDSILTMAPGFGMYEAAAAVSDVRVLRTPLSAPDFEFSAAAADDEVDGTTRVVFLCTPNNPTGNSISPNEIRSVLHDSANLADTIVVIDEAYIDFSPHPSAIELLAEAENLVVLQTFSKAFGAAGVRLGMGFMSPQIVEILNRIKLPYNISELTQREALRSLADLAPMHTSVVALINERRRLETELGALASVVHVHPSDANFVLVRFHDSELALKSLLAAGVVVRDRSTQPGCENCLRISVGTPDENTVLLDTLASMGGQV